MMGSLITVYGAYGHTGRFVVSELVARGFRTVLSGRDPARLGALAVEFPESTVRVARVDDSDALDTALAGSAAVINCAGPFAHTAPAVVEAALRAKIHYLDVAAEIEANLDTLSSFGARARDAGVVVLPAMAFFGGLGDLLATAVSADLPEVDEISIAYGLSGWQPTDGTRAAGRVSRERRGGRRISFANGQAEYRGDQPPAGEWVFPLPLGKQAVATEFTMADALTISHHIRVSRLNSYMTATAVGELIDPATPPPARVDDQGRSGQTFLVDLVARGNGELRRIYASGRDIYAITAPLVVEALSRLLDGSAHPAGVFTAGQLFDAEDFLGSLRRDLRIHRQLLSARSEKPCLARASRTMLEEQAQ